MTRAGFPSRGQLTICFAHAAYQLEERFVRRNSGLKSFAVRNLADLQARIAEADVLVVSGLWRNELLTAAPRLAFVQSVSAGTDQYSREAIAAAGVRLASAQGVNERAVAEHAIALILSITRRLAEARDNQRLHQWRGMIADCNLREDELQGKTLVIVGMGRIGSRLAQLAKAFDMRVIGVRRSAGGGSGVASGAVGSSIAGVASGAHGSGIADAVVGSDRLHDVLSEADFVALTCPLTPETENLVNGATLSSMRPTAWLINLARGRVVDEAALLAALRDGRIAGAALDCAREEPLPADSPLWDAPNVLITPHSAGETQRYEDNVIDVLLENLDRLWRGETVLKNQVV